MPLKRKYTITQTHPDWHQDKVKEVEAEAMKTLDGNVILMDFDEEGCRYNEVAFFTPPVGGRHSVTSVNL